MSKKSYLLTDKNDLELEKKRLKIQAKVMFEFEKPIFESTIKNKRNCLLDFGCGNGSFLKLTAPYFKKSYGIDINKDLVKEAQVTCPESTISCLSFNTKNDLFDFLKKINPSIILLRFVLQHFTENEWWIIEALSQFCQKEDTSLLIIDVDDSETTLSPYDEDILNNYKSITQYIQSKGGNRLLNSKIDSMYSKFNLPKPKKRNADLIFNKNNVDDFLLVVFPIFKKSLPSRTMDSIKEDYTNYFFKIEGTLRIPIFYHLID